MNRKKSLDELERISLEEFKRADKHPIYLVLDNIRSMHNVGSCLRSADAFRVEKVFLCGITPKPPHREIRKTAIGAEDSVAWEAHEDVLQLAQELKNEGFNLLAIEQTEGSIPLQAFEADLTREKYAIFLGHEVEGVQQSLIDLCDQVLEIPQFGTKHSLNVSVALGISLFQLVLAGGKHTKGQS